VPAPSIEPALIWLLLFGPVVPEKSTVPPALVMNRALPPSLLEANCVCEPALVVMVALPAVLVSVKDSKKPPALVRMFEFPAELELVKVIAPLLVKLGANAELLTMPEPLISKSARLTAKEYAGAPAVNSIVPIEVVLEIVTEVGAPLLVNVAVPSGTAEGFQLVPVVHSDPGPVQVASAACAAFGAATVSAPSQTLPSSAARVSAGWTRGAMRIATAIAARGADCARGDTDPVRNRNRRKRITDPYPTRAGRTVGWNPPQSIRTWLQAGN
jgi:hypothetical protein